MPQINHVRESGLGLDGVETVFIDTSSLSELPSHLMHPQDLETFVGLNIHSSDLEALQVSSDSHDAGMLISDGVSVENDETDMDTSDPLPSNSQVMEVDSLQDNEVIDELDLLHDGQEFLPITGTEEMMEQSNDDDHQKSLLCSSSSSSFNQEDSGVASEESNQHVTGVESLGPQILKTSSGQFVILQPNQNSISLGALGGKILSGSQIFTSLSSINCGNSKPIFVNASQLSGIKQITNLNQSQPQFRSVQLKQPLLLSQPQNSGPVTKVILPSQPGVSLSQQLRLMTSQANTNNQSGNLTSSPSKITLQFQPISLLSSKNMQSPTKPYINDVKPETKLKIPLNFPFKTGTTIPMSQFTSMQSDELNEVLNNSDNLMSTVKTTTSNSPQKIIIKGKLPLNTAHSLPTTIKPGQILASSTGMQQLIKIPVSQLSQLTSQGQTIQVGNKMNFRLLTTNSNTMTTTNNFISSNQTLFKSVNINKPIAPNNNVVKPKTLPVSNQTLTINHQGKRLLIPISNHNVISQSSSNTAGAVHIRPQGSITLPASALPPGVLSNAQPGSLVMIPAQYFQNTSNSNQIIQVSNQISQISAIPSLPNKNATQKTLIDANGIKPRKPCNCTKSQCLKLYCDCFANGEFCNNCNCTNCYNNLTHEEDRQKAIKSCLERNPQAFRPKIGKGGNDSERRHNKGCNCKRSGCLKNYCECFEAKIPCSNMCKCNGCRNIDSGQPFERKKLIQLAEIAESRGSKPVAMKSRPISLSSLPSPLKMSFSSNSKSLLCRINQEVVEATCQCLLAQAEKSEKTLSDEETELRVINEFSRCLLQIIGANSKSRGSVD